jgi:hypothetical protein
MIVFVAGMTYVLFCDNGHYPIPTQCKSVLHALQQDLDNSDALSIHGKSNDIMLCIEPFLRVLHDFLRADKQHSQKSVFRFSSQYIYNVFSF